MVSNPPLLFTNSDICIRVIICFCTSSKDVCLRTVAEQDRCHQSIKDVFSFLARILMSDLNVLIMNYLVHQGYPSSAVSFAKEANLALSQESMDSITARMKIRNKIHAGDIESAIHDIHTLNPQVPRPLCFFSNDYMFNTIL